MTEGSQTAVVRPRMADLDLLALYEELTVAIQRVAAASRMHQTECRRLLAKGNSIQDVRIAWHNATEVLDSALSAAQQAHDAIMANASSVCRALRDHEAASAD